jgi:hypothetical protein
MELGQGQSMLSGASVQKDTLRGSGLLPFKEWVNAEKNITTFIQNAKL